MIRKIIHIDEARCNGCGACAQACHEGAIAMVDGKARLARENYCDGFGDCLPACPTGAITFEEREAPAYDAAAVARAKQAPCPGAKVRDIRASGAPLQNWPVQIKLAPVQAPYYDGADLLIAADCTAYAYSRFHDEFIHGHAVLIACPKLDSVDYAEKLTQIFARNSIRSLTLTRMEVPCCGGLEFAVKRALEASGAAIACRAVTISIDGKILEDRHDL